MMVPTALFVLTSLFVLFPDCACQCEDKNSKCSYWASVDECLVSPSYMMCNCPLSCSTPVICNITSSNDTDCQCREWAKQDQCDSVESLCPTACEMRQSIECSQLPVVPNAHAVPTKETYNFLDSIHFECDEGYADAVGSIPTLVCNETTDWNNPRKVAMPKCEVVVCGTPPTVAQASWSGSSFEYSQTVIYACDAGYQTTSGSDVKTCTAAKEWTGSDLVCEKISCGPPPDLTNAVVTHNETLYQDEATYACLTGYNSSVREVTKVCFENGTWLGPDISCNVIECGAAPEVENADVNVVDYTYLTDANYSCHYGYEHTGGDVTKTCDQDGVWQGSSISCTAVDCGSPPAFINTDVAYRSTTFRSAADYACTKGYNSSRSTWRFACEADATWIGESPQCSVIECGIPPEVEFAQVTFASTVYQSKSTYSCVRGYEYASGSLSKTCADTGVWIGIDSVCKVVSCGAPPDVTFSSHETSGTTFRSTASYSCILGYNMAGGETEKQCTEFGNWEGVDINCTIVICEAVPVLENAHVTGSYTREYATSVSFKCDPGYYREDGNTTLTCREDGHWFGNRLKCKEKPSPAETIGIIKKFEPEVFEAEGSVTLGVAAIVVMVLIVGGIFLLDLTTVCRHLRYMKENLADFFRRNKHVQVISKSARHYGTDA